MRSQGIYYCTYSMVVYTWPYSPQDACRIKILRIIAYIGFVSSALFIIELKTILLYIRVQICMRGNNYTLVK